MSKEDQIIFAIDCDDLFGSEREHHFEGFRKAEEIDYMSKLLEKGKWMRRGDIENNHSVKHPIPYIVVVSPEGNKVFAYQRASGHTEQRLGGKWTWGVGGHIEKIDESENMIEDSLRREVEEEIKFAEDKHEHIKPGYHFLGYINNDEDDVGKVHLGLLYVHVTDAKQVFPNEAEVARGELRDINELELMLDSESDVDVEGWSRIALPEVKKFLENYDG